MKTLGIFEAKTKLSEVCKEVAETHEPVIVTKRGKPLVRIGPIEERYPSVKERREQALAVAGSFHSERGDLAKNHDAYFAEAERGERKYKR